MPNSRLRSSVFAMSFLSSDDRVRRETKSLFAGKKPAELPFHIPVRTRVTAAAYRPQKYRRIRDAANAFNLPLQEAEAQGSSLAAFSELSALCFLGLLPRAEAVLAEMRENMSAPERAQLFSEAVQTTQGFMGEVFFNLFSELSRAHKMLIAAGGFYAREDGRIRNRQYLFSENGEVLGQQDKMILSPLERELGVEACPRLSPVDTRIGRIALLTASCAQHYEPFAVAAACGCRIAVAGASPFGDDISLLPHRAREQALVVLTPGIEKSDMFYLPETVPCAASLPQNIMRTAGENAVGQSRHSLTVRADLSSPPEPDHYRVDHNPAFFRALLREKPADADKVLGDLMKEKKESGL